MPDSPLVIDGKYAVLGLCSNAGGMGTLLFVSRVGTDDPRLVLKQCKLTDPEMLARFKREVRLMQEFKGNNHVMPILDANLEHEPPYFVMPHFPHGDLHGKAALIRGDYSSLEFIFFQMLDCVAQLHDRHVYHRDIKPQNFLLDRFGNLVISDFGLCTEEGSSSAFTRSTQWAGTVGYMPPEFLHGGFKNASAPADIFMLGKSFYGMLTGRDPMYLIPDGVPPQLLPVLERCCAISKELRYQSLASLKQSMKAAFDVLLGRASGSEKVYALLRAISDRLRVSNQYQPDEIGRFVEDLALLETEDQFRVCLELPEDAFSILSQSLVAEHLAHFLVVYRRMVEEATYSFSFAETIADNMKILFHAQDTPPSDKAEALRIAIIAAVRQNRFAAMDTCRAMITSIEDAELGQRAHDVLVEHATYFIRNIDANDCKSGAVRAAINSLKAAADDGERIA
jgi:serine/threonine protein kinase